jgi:hypothetical protein
MTKPLVVHLEDKPNLRESYKNLESQLALNIEYVQCASQQELQELIEERGEQIKCLIFDLFGDSPETNELQHNEAEFLNKIKESFSNFNIPIFIYSAFIDRIDDQFINDGTVFKISKDESIEVIFNKIKIFEESGFLNIFSKGGLIDEEIRKDINKAFRLQFTKNHQILDVIKQIKAAHQNNYVPRVQSVFRRVAVRSLMSGLLSPRTEIDGTIENETVNTIEHYVQRLSPYKFWTGDIFKNGNEEHILILTPRCDVANDRFNTLLVCPLKLGFEPKKPDEVRRALNGDIKKSGYSRFLAPSPVFPGGEAKLSEYFFIPKETVTADFIKVITLSDELINEISSRFSTIFLRTGITSWNEHETLAHIQAQNG